MPGLRLLPALLAASVLLPASAAGAATCAGADTPISAASLDSARTAVTCLVNAERTARGLPALGTDDHLALAAQRHTDDMVRRGFFSHEAPAPAPNGTDPGSRIEAAGYDWQRYGENIAVGFVTPRATMIGWMASPGHCRNILDPGVTELGVGVADSPATLGNQPGGTWTQDFARPDHTSARSNDTGPQDACPYQGLVAVAAAAVIARPAAPVSAPAAPAVAPRAALRHLAAARVVRAGQRIVLKGRVAVPDGSTVRITVRRGGRVVRRIKTHARHHQVYARIRAGRRGARYAIRLACGPLRITRTIA